MHTKVAHVHAVHSAKDSEVEVFKALPGLRHGFDKSLLVFDGLDLVWPGQKLSKSAFVFLNVIKHDLGLFEVVLLQPNAV